MISKTLVSSMVSALALAALTFSSVAPAHAQIAAALGRPLPVASDAAGTVTVRVVNGDPSAPASGLDVTLELGSGPRVARSAADGRATFTAVPAGAEAMIKIPGKNGEVTSQPFTMPSSGGVRLLMSTTGAFGGGGGGGAAEQGGAEQGGGGGPMGGGGGGGQPSLRQRSGGVIAASGTPATSLAIRLSYDDPSDTTPPKDHPVHLVSYSFDEKIALVTKNSDGDGRVVFDGLDVSGATAYFAMTLLPRGDTFERLLAGPIIAPGGAGLAMVLSAEKRTSTAPPVDDLFKLLRFEGAVPAGQVVVEAQGEPEIGAKVVLREVATGKELLASTLVAPPPPAAGSEDKPGSWPTATFDASKQIPGQLVYAEGQMNGQMFRSLPFQLVPDRGARASLLVGPRVMMRFSLTSALDEDYFAFRGRFQLANNSWFPYKHSEDGMPFPLPAGASGAQVTEEDASEISPVPGMGLRLLRPLPPGGKTFIAGWSMPTKGGEVHWDLELPFGTTQSGMEIMQSPGTTVELPPGVEGRTVQVAKGSYFILPDISIRPNQRMVLTIHGLPTAPAWKLWMPRLVGGAVVLILLGGLVFAFRRGGAGGADAEASEEKAQRAAIDALMNELVALEGKTDEKSELRRAEVMAQLERLWPTAGQGAGSSADAKASA